MYHVSPDKRSYESSGMIYDALVELMKEKEYSKIKINELCERAKLGRVTFYRHYDAIDDVLRKNSTMFWGSFKRTIKSISESIRLNSPYSSHCCDSSMCTLQSFISFFSPGSCTL